MKTALLAAAITIGALSPAYADAFSRDLICRIDRPGHQAAWTFANNAADGPNGGSFVETGYSGDGKEVYSQPGLRPVWGYYANNLGGFTMVSQNDPGWSIIVSRLGRVDGASINGTATLTHGGQFVGTGVCMRHVNSALQGDVAPE